MVPRTASSDRGPEEKDTAVLTVSPERPDAYRRCGYVLLLVPVLVAVSDFSGISAILIRHERWLGISVLVLRTEVRWPSMSASIVCSLLGVICLALPRHGQSQGGIVMQACGAAAACAGSIILLLGSLIMALESCWMWEFLDDWPLPHLIACPLAFMFCLHAQLRMRGRRAASRATAGCVVVASACLLGVVLALLSDDSMHWYWGLRGK